MKYLTDRKRAEGLGAGGAGAHHHWKMIVSSILLVVMVPLFVLTFGSTLGGTEDEVAAKLSSPLVALILGLGLVVGVHHFMLEIHEAIEDYVGGIKRKLALVAATAFSYTLIAAGLLALLKLAL